MTADDPPIYLIYGTPPALGQDQKDPTHTSNFGVKLQEKCQSVGVECELVYPGAPDVKHPTCRATSSRSSRHRSGDNLHSRRTGTRSRKKGDVPWTAGLS